MYTHMRREDRLLPAEDARAILEEGDYGVVSLVTPDGAPYAIPISYATIGDAIYFHGTNEGGLRYNFSKLATQASFIVVGNEHALPEKFSVHYESVIVDGPLNEVNDDEEKRAALVAFVDKYSSEHMEDGLIHIDQAIGRTAVFRLDIETISGKGNLA